MKAGDRNDMPDSAELQSRIAFIAQFTAVTQKKRLGKRKYLAGQYQRQSDFDPMCQLRTQVSGTAFSRCDRDFFALIAQQKDSSTRMEGRGFFPIKGIAQRKGTRHLIARFQKQIFLTVKPDGAGFAIHRDLAVANGSVIGLPAVIRYRNSQFRCFPVQGFQGRKQKPRKYSIPDNTRQASQAN